MLKNVPENVVMGGIYNITLKNGNKIKAMATETYFYPEGWCFEGMDYLDYRVDKVKEVRRVEE